MKRITVFVICCFLVSFTSAYGQQGSHLAVQYDMSFGMGDLGDFISAPSFRGASLQYRYAVTDNILVGVDAAWNTFYEKMDYDSYTVDTKTLSGIQYRYQNEVPILVSVDYLFLTDNKFQPYLGLGIGTIYSERIVDMGIWRFEEDPWQFALKPEFGLMYNFSNSTAFKLGLKYYTGMGGDLDTQGYLTISAGFAFSL
ncbi:MAG TPA: outer membrane beta-barrel protein [Bacteroidales bacterium]|nr:outer membrane beta-barrel protein [Bacteroidales bacterium]